MIFSFVIINGKSKNLTNIAKMKEKLCYNNKIKYNKFLIIYSLEISQKIKLYIF